MCMVETVYPVGRVAVMNMRSELLVWVFPFEWFWRGWGSFVCVWAARGVRLALPSSF